MVCFEAFGGFGGGPGGGFGGPGGGLNGNRSSGKPLLLLRLKNKHPQDHQNHKENYKADHLSRPLPSSRSREEHANTGVCVRRMFYREILMRL